MHQTIKLDTRKREGKYGEARIAPLRRGERNNAMLTVKVGANGQPYDLSGKTASLVATTAAGKLVGPCPMQVAEAGIARIMLPAALYSAVGAFSGYVEIREGETLVDTTDSFGGKVIECADLDSEQAAEFTPLLGEVRDATVKALESRIIHAEVETLDPGSDATASLVPEDGAQCLRLGIPRGDTGAKGDKGEKGDPFTYDDFTEAQILELQRPATEAAASVDAINVIAPKTVDTAQAASAAYKNSLAIGEGAKCTSDKYTQLAIGAISKTQGANAISVGLAAEADGPASVSMGLNAHSEGGYSVAIGTASAANGERSKAFGDYAQSIGNRTDALSSTAYCVGNISQALGYQSSTCATQSAAIGAAATVNGASVPDPAVKDFKASTMNSVALGSFSVADEQNTVSVGNDVASITKYRRKSDGTGKLTETAPFWETRTVNLPASAQHLKRRITNVADPIDGHNAATKNYVDSNTCNVLIGSETGAVAHVEDAFNGASLRKITVEGATEQVTTTGKNLLDCYKLAEIASKYYAVENGNLKVIQSYNEAWSAVPAFITLDAGTYYSSGDKSLEIRKASDGATVRYGEGRFVLDQNTEIKIKVGTGLPSYPVVINAQIEKGSTATAYEPYTGGKPSPSPEYQQPIAVIENPTVKIVGRNHARIAADMPRADCDTDFAATTKRIIPPGTYIEGLTFNNYLAPNNISELKIAEGSIGFDTTDQGYGVGVGVNLVNGATYVDGVADYHSFYDEDGTFLRYVYGRQFQVPDDAAYSVAVFRAGADGHFSASNIAITHVADKGAYAPYNSQSIAFTLPEEHPYLAKLPDGTADTIEVDKDGNVSLVARATKTILDGSQSFYDVNIDGIETYYELSKPIGSGKLPAVQWGGLYDRFVTSNPYTVHQGACAYCFSVSNGIIFRIRPSETFASAKGFNNWLKSNPVTSYHADTEPKTYPLGKIEMPKAQDSIVNAWTDAEVTPRTGIEYTRDVNIVVANLESAIASITEG